MPTISYYHNDAAYISHCLNLQKSTLSLFLGRWSSFTVCFITENVQKIPQTHMQPAPTVLRPLTSKKHMTYSNLKEIIHLM
ncbi:Hypothetical predicted protein [Podarcis lilfordi]|uniref:Uncharacterized protein n=1 Tax=Podarcis lilfordi TaxID=74358 RepID=A0AA35JQ52_9SAUR|nr:Hypothetical predicted protein [Podarcis lilfordi]